MPGNPGERQPGDNPQFHHTLPVEFEPFQGTQNFPTWSVFTSMTSYFETYDMLQNMASQPTGGRGAVRRAILGTVEHWKLLPVSIHAEAARVLVQGFLMNGVRRVEWTPVVDTLRGEKKELGETNALTTLAYDLLSQTDWRAIVKGAETFTNADTLLQDWLEAQLFTWVDSLDARKQTGSAGRFANTVLDIYFQAVQWEKVTDKLKSK